MKFKRLKKLFRIIAVVLIFALTLSDYGCILNIKAAGIEDGSNLLNSVKIKNANTNTEMGTGSNIQADDQLLVEYYLKDIYPLGAGKNVEQGTAYSFKVPDELKVLSQGSWTLRVGNNTLGQCSYDSGTHTIQVTFDDGCFDANGFAADGVTGMFIGFTACLDSDKLGNQDNQVLKFQIAGGEYEFSFLYGEDASMSKSGIYDEASEKITWTITIEEGSKSYEKLVFKDTFSSNQEYVDGSLKERIGDSGNFTACSNVTVSGKSISYEYIPSGSTRTFRYETKFTDEALNPNNAVNDKINLTATNSASIVYPSDNNKEIAKTGLATVNATVTVESQNPSTVILDKVGKWHVREDNGLLWHVKVNEAKQNFGNDVYLIETIGGSQVQTGDIKQILGDNPIRNVKVNKTEATQEQLNKIKIEPAGTGFTANEYKISFGDLLDGNTVEFDFFTRMSEEEIDFYQGNNNTDDLARTGRNTVTMYQTTTMLKSIDAIVRAYPKVLDKSFENYDYNTRELEWKIDVNYDFMKLDDVVLEDTISAGSFADKVIVKTYEDGDSTYVVDTTQLSDIPNQTGMYYDYNEQTKLLTIYLGDIPRNTKYDVLVYSVIGTDDEINDNGTIKTLSNYNGDIQVSNKVTMKKEGSSPVTVEATGTINNKVLEKSGKVTAAGVASYEIKLNQAQMTWPQQSEIVDIMSPGMMLDAASIQLYEAEVSSDGSMVAISVVDKDLYERNHVILEENNVYGEEAGSTMLTVVLPDNASNKAYILKYDAVLEEDTTYEKFTNKVKLQGVTSKETNTDTIISIQDLKGYGGATVITYSKVKIIKYNEEQEPLKGAEFALFMDGEEIDRKISDDKGEIIFSYLTPGSTYVIKEMKAPVGYVKDEGSWEFVAKDKGDRYYLDNPHIFINKKETTSGTEDDNTSETTEEPKDDDTSETTEEPKGDDTSETTEEPKGDDTTETTEEPKDDNTTETTEEPKDDATAGTTEESKDNNTTGTTENSKGSGDALTGTNQQPQTGDNSDDIILALMLCLLSLGCISMYWSKKKI